MQSTPERVASSPGAGHAAACPKVNPARFGEPCSLPAGHEGECVAADLPVAAPAREIGPYRCNVIEATGVYVSTIFRESSAMEYASPYFETMALWLTDRKPEGARAILWQSAGRFEREADRQHDLAVRWFSREGVRFLA